MAELTHEQRDQVLALWREGKYSVSGIAKKLGLLREYVAAYVRYLNSHREEVKNE